MKLAWGFPVSILFLLPSTFGLPQSGATIQNGPMAAQPCGTTVWQWSAIGPACTPEKMTLVGECADRDCGGCKSSTNHETCSSGLISTQVRQHNNQQSVAERTCQIVRSPLVVKFVIRVRMLEGAKKFIMPAIGKQIMCLTEQSATGVRISFN